MHDWFSVSTILHVEVPSQYYDSIQPSQEIVELAAALDIPAVLGQIMLFYLVWICTRVNSFFLLDCNKLGTLLAARTSLRSGVSQCDPHGFPRFDWRTSFS